jgi:hypothetical protein
MEKMMKKHTIIIAFIAVLLLSMVALEAVQYNIVVHVTTLGPASGGYEITDSNPNYNYNWINGSNSLPLTGPLGATFSC